MSRELRRELPRVIAAAVMSLGLMSATAGVAGAETTTATDRAKDKPAIIDLTRATFTYGDHRYVAKVHVRDLRWRGTFNFNFLINAADQAYGEIHVQAHPRKKTLSTSTSWEDRGTFERLDCHPRTVFRPDKNYVSVSVRRGCFPMKMNYTQFIVESIGMTNGNLRFDDIDGTADYD